MTFRRLLLGIGLGCAFGGMALTPAAAEEPASAEDALLAITVTGNCPPQEAIGADMRAMVPARDLEKVSAAQIEVSDLGTTYHVRIVADGGERQRTFRDMDHDCDHRARFAAIFIVVTLLPPDVLLEAPPEPTPAPPARLPATPPTVVAVAPVPSVSRSKRIHIDVSALFDSAPAIGGSGQSTMLGGEARAFWGARHLAAVAAVGLEPKASFDFGGVGVAEARVPFDIGLGLVRSWSRLAFVGEVGAAGAVVTISGTNTASPRSGTRLDLGGRLAVGMRLGSPSWAVTPVVGIHALIFPKPYEAMTTPQGDVGKLPGLWLGLTAGVSFAP